MKILMNPTTSTHVWAYCHFWAGEVLPPPPTKPVRLSGRGVENHGPLLSFRVTLVQIHGLLLAAPPVDPYV